MNVIRPVETATDAVAEADPLPPHDRLLRSSRNLLGQLYHGERPRLLRFFARRAGTDEADDLVQETFARYAGRTDAGGSLVAEPQAYLTRVATNLLRDRAKFAVRRAAAFHQVFDDEVFIGSDPVARLETRDLLSRLDKAVQRLKPRTRRVFLLQRVDGMSYAQIAENTGMSVKAVKKQMAKALFELRRDIGPL